VLASGTLPNLAGENSMRKILGALALLFPIVVLTSRRKATTTAPAPAPVRSLALVGDSLAVGLEGPLRALAAAKGLPFYADAQGGASVSHFTATRLAPVPSGATVVVSLGGNDRLATWRAKELPGLVRDFLCALRPRPVFWLDTPFPTLEDRTHVSETWRACAPAILDIGTADDWASERAGDGIHLTPAGYRHLAALIFDALVTTT